MKDILPANHESHHHPLYRFSTHLLKLQRFLWLYTRELQPYADRIGRVDLRYRNGLALSWKEGMAVPVVNNQLKKQEQVATQDGR